VANDGRRTDCRPWACLPSANQRAAPSAGGGTAGLGEAGFRDRTDRKSVRRDLSGVPAGRIHA